MRRALVEPEPSRSRVCAKVSALPVVWSLVLCLAVLGACDVQVVRIGYGSSASLGALAGEWSGSWSSSADGSSGELSLRVQQFHGQPLVQLLLDNPCLRPGDYTLSVRGGVIQFSQGDAVVLTASQQADGRLAGAYSCAGDHGVLAATWSKALPEPLDLTGSWSGELLVAGMPTQPLQVDLVQHVAEGALAIDAVVAAPGAELLLALQGAVDFTGDGFQFQLRTAPGVTPEVVFSGLGTRVPLQVELGVVQVFGDGAPFATGIVHLAPE